MNRQISYPFSVFVINKMCVGWRKYSAYKIVSADLKTVAIGFCIELEKVSCLPIEAVDLYCTNLNIIASIVIFDSAKIAIEHANEVTLPHDRTYMSFKRHRNKCRT